MGERGNPQDKAHMAAALSRTEAVICPGKIYSGAQRLTRGPNGVVTQGEERLADGSRPSARKHGGCAVVGR
jgi:hypothetical protein